MFQLWESLDNSIVITLEKRGEDSWGIYRGSNFVWNTHIKWFSYKGLPSSRNTANTRFNFQEAITISESIVKLYQTALEEFQQGKTKFFFPPQPQRI